MYLYIAYILYNSVSKP